MREWTIEDDYEVRRAINNRTKLDALAAMFKCGEEEMRARLRQLGHDDQALFPRDIAAS